MIVKALRKTMGEKRYTTVEMELLLISVYGYRCPDELSRSLNKLRQMGELCGELDREGGCMVWWAPPEKGDQPE